MTSLHTPAIGIRNIGGRKAKGCKGSLLHFFSFSLFPHGRVVAKIVCALGFEPGVRHFSAIRSMPFPVLPRCSPSYGGGLGGRMGLVSFDSDYSGGGGASLLFSEVSLIPCS